MPCTGRGRTVTVTGCNRGPYFWDDEHYTHSRRAGRREIALLRMKGGDIIALLLLSHEDSYNNLGNVGEEEKSDP